MVLEPRSIWMPMRDGSSLAGDLLSVLAVLPMTNG